MVDVEAGDDPQFILKRISRGNENIYRDNEQRDEITVRMNNNTPDQPYGISPNGIENPDSIILSASSFSDIDGDFAMAAQWEIYQNCDLSSEAIVSKSSGENLRTDGITIDSTIVDQKPGRRNVRFCIYSTASSP